MQKVDLNRLRWDDVRVILAAAQTGSIGAMARLLDVDGTTVSRRLSVIDDMFGLAVFARARGRLKLTAFGERLLPHAEAMQLAANQMAVEIAKDRAEPSGEVRLSAPPTFSRAILAPALGEFLGKYPGISLDFAVEPANVQLEQWEADLAVRLDLPRTAPESLLTRRLGTMAYAPYEASKGEIADRWISVARQFSHVSEARWIDAQPGDNPIALRSNDPEIMATATEAGAGRSLLPVVLGDGRAGLRRAGTPAIEREVWLLQHRDIARLPHVQAVAGWIVSLCRRVLNARA